MKTTRKKKPVTVDPWPVFDSIGQAAAAIGVPVAALKRDKRDGCPAFKSNRVYAGAWLQWHFSREQSEDPNRVLMELKARRETAKAIVEETEAKKAKETVIAKADARRALTRYASAVRSKLLALPQRNALPLSLLKEPQEIEQRLAAEVRSVLGEVFRGEWGPIECPNCKKPIKP